jgi:NAD(P)-dependent dehydrogenase (short-subunit alcohol dehydrogenase family)
MGQLSEKIALVTGASRGIGRATAERLARDGATVAVHYGRNADEAAKTVQAIEAAGGKAFAVQGDVSNVAGIAGLFEALDRELAARGLSGLDILVNNAGVAPSAPFAETTEALFDENFNVNVKGLFFVTQNALTRLRDGGRIINISSVVARSHFDGISAYSATKGAVNTLTAHLAAELGMRGITVNAVAPGAIDTDMNPWLKNEEGRGFVLATQSLKRVGVGADIANAVAFLAGPDSGWVTGQIVEASGGSKL